MKRTFVLALLLAAFAVAQEKSAIRFRLKKDPNAPMRGWILDYDEKGFTYEAFGTGKKVFIRWEELVEDDASRLRQHYKLELTRDEKLGLMPGQEMFFKGGGSRRGLLHRHDEPNKIYWFRHDGLILPYPEDRVDRFEEVKVKEADVYSEEEVYIRRLERTPPASAVEHTALAAYMYDIGNWKKADRHYRQAVQLDPDLHREVDPRLAEIKDYLEDEAAGTFFRKAKSLANLHGDYDGAVKMIEGYIEQYPGSKRRGIKVIDEIRRRRHQKYVVLFHRSKNRALDRIIRNYLSKKQPDIQTAMSWTTSGLGDEIERWVRQRMRLSREEYEEFREERPKYSPHYATYWSGTFVISKRARKGKSSTKTIRGDPDSWWYKYADVQTRSTWLKAYAAERNPELFEVVSVRTTPCEKCGGKGQVKHTSLRGLKALDGGHEWWETCPRCFGAREDRSVAYR